MSYFSFYDAYIYIYISCIYIYIYIISIYLPIFLFLYLSLSLSIYIYIYLYCICIYISVYVHAGARRSSHALHGRRRFQQAFTCCCTIAYICTDRTLQICTHTCRDTHTHKHTYIHMSGDTQCCRSKISDWLVICAPHVWSNQPQEVQCLVKLRIKNSTCCYACYMKENHGNPDVFPLLLAVLAGTMCFFSSTVR